MGEGLPGRNIIVVTRCLGYRAEGVCVAHDLEAAVALARRDGEEEVFIAGGGMVYREALTWVDRIYLTRIHAHLEGDAFFPVLNEQEWVVRRRSSHVADEQNPYACEFMLLERTP